MRKVLPMVIGWFFLLLSISLQAQERVVSGKVTSAEDGIPIPGVNVVLRGSTNGVVTDSDGNFRLSVSGSNVVLVFSFIGMSTKEESIGDRSTIDVQLEADVTQLQEVVVNAIGETVTKDKLGVATSSINGSAVVQSGESGVINGLAGKAAGVTITRNGGDPGAGSYIQLRGQSTVTGNLQPLIVIDGMPMYNDNLGSNTAGVQQQSRLNDLNPADIASVEIIKSASGAALWGSRAANGVIVITTKKGKAGKLSASYSGTLSFDKVNKMPDLQTTFGQGTRGRYVFGTNTSYGDLISGRAGGADSESTTGAFVTFPNGIIRHSLAGGTAANPHGGKNSQDVYDHRYDVFQTGHMLENNINLTSGTDKTQFFASYSNLSQEGIIKLNSDYKKNTARINLSQQITPKLNVAANVNFSNIRSNRIQQGSNTSGILLGMLRTAPDFDNSEWIGNATSSSGTVFVGKQISYRNPIGANSSSGYDNPYWSINKNKSFSVVNRFIGNLELNYDITDWLSLKGNTGLDTYADRRTDFGNAQSISFLTGSYTEQYVQQSQWNTNLYATAKKKLSDNFSGSIQVGFNYNNQSYNNVGATVTNFIIPDAPPNFANTPPANRSPFNNASTIRTSAGFTQINAEIGDQLFINLTGRAESASTFGPQAKSLFYYPSASAAWQFTKLIGASSVLSFGKLRVSYGVVGKQPGAYLNLTQFGAQTYSDSWGPTLTAASYGVGGLAISTQAGNQKLKPERKHEIEGGVDLRFFENKINFSATAYYNKTTDAILSTQVAPTSGFTNQVGNAGVIENKGIELVLGSTWLRTSSGFTWSTDVIWSAYRNRVLDLAGAEYVYLAGFTDGSSVAAKGHPLGVLWGTHYDQNSDGSYNLDAKGFPQLAQTTGVIGNPNPKYRASLGNTFSFKNVSLYVLAETLAGSQMWNGTQGALFNFGTTAASANITTVSAADAAVIKNYEGYTLANIASGAGVPSSRTSMVWQNGDGSYSFRGTVQDFGGGKVALDQTWYQGPGNGFNVNAPFVQNSNWTRLREVTLSYLLNSVAFRSATKLSSISFAVTGRNIALWTPYKGIDPDTNLTGASNGRGLDYFQNPNTKSILFKLTITY